MKILIYQWNVFNQEDIKSAFENFGHDVDMYKCLSSENKKTVIIQPDKLQEMRDTFSEYDMIFSVNYFWEVSDVCEEIGKIYVSWTVDSPMITMYHDSVYNKCNYIFIFDQFQYVQFKNMGVKNVYYLPLAVNTKRIQTQLLQMTAEEKTLYNNEIAFVGGLYHKNSYDAIEPSLSAYLRGYFDAAMEAQMDIYGDNLFDSLLNVPILEMLSEQIEFKKDERSFSDLKLVFTSTYLGYKLAQKERIKYLNELAKKYVVKLYSDETDADLKNVIYAGTVNYLHDMPKVFAESKINLNLTIRNIRTGIPLRVWDILGSGGFVMTNYQVELNSFFENGKNIVYFDGLQDCLRKTEYYLTHEEERKTIAVNGLKTVEKYHSYNDRIEKILKQLKINNAI